MSGTGKFWAFCNEWPEKSACYNFNARFSVTLNFLDCINSANKHCSLHVKPAEFLEMVRSQKAKWFKLVKPVEKCAIEVSIWGKITPSFAKKRNIFRKSFWTHSGIFLSLGKTNQSKKQAMVTYSVLFHFCFSHNPHP